MTVTAVRKDPAALTMTLDAEFEASPERVWQLWADPRQLERWWGPPTYPATVTSHDLRAGGRVEYHMTGPEGDQPRGYWECGPAGFACAAMVEVATIVEPGPDAHASDGISRFIATGTRASGICSTDLCAMDRECRRRCLYPRMAGGEA